MAMYAQTQDAKVIAVHLVSDDIEDGAEFLADLHGGQPSDWIQTYTDGTRGKQASIDDVYDPLANQFLTPAASPITP